MDKSRICCAIWPWGTATREQMEQAAKEVTQIGYSTFESVKAAIYAYDMDIEAYKEVLSRYQLKPESFYFHLPERGTEDDFFKNIDAELKFVSDLGVTKVTLQATMNHPDRKLTEEELSFELKLISCFARSAKKYSITTNLHPHDNTWVMHEEEIDYIMQNTEKELLSFAPDMAHLVAGGCDPVAVTKKYADRINFIHLKDIRDFAAESQGYATGGMEVYKNFCELGTGKVDFKSIFDILKECNYQGPLCVELDIAPVSNVQSAEVNFKYVLNNY